MPAVEVATTIPATPERVYDLVSRVDEFTRYSPHIDSITKVAPDRYRWRVCLGGMCLSWEASVTEKVPGSRFAWRTLSGVDNSGSYDLSPTANGGTRVRLRIEYRLKSRLMERVVHAAAEPMIRHNAAQVLERIAQRIAAEAQGES